MRILIIFILFLLSCSSADQCDYSVSIQTNSICNIYIDGDSLVQDYQFNLPDLQSLRDSIQSHLLVDPEATSSVLFDSLNRTWQIEILNSSIPFDSVRYSNSPNCTWPEYISFIETCE